MTKRVKAHIQNVLNRTSILKILFNKVCYLLLVGLTFISCSGDRQVVTSYPIEKELHGKRLSEFDTLYNAYGVNKFGDNLVFSLIRSDNFLYVYNMEKHMGYCSLKRGHGNGELLAPLVTGQQIEINGKDYICVGERESNVLYAVDLSSTSPDLIKITDFKSKSGNRQQSVIYAYITGENSFIGAFLAESSSLFTCNGKADKLIAFQPPSVDPAMFEANKFELSQTRSTYNSVQKKMATGYFSFPLVNITDNQGKDNVTLQLEDALPKYTKANRETPHQYIIDISSTEDNIYVLYDASDNYNYMEILAFCWDGSPVARYRVPRLTSFTVDMEQKRFVGLMEDDSNGVCYEFSYRDA